MNRSTDKPELIDEIATYLSAVELFRELGCEPTWRPESTPLPATAAPRLASTATASAH